MRTNIKRLMGIFLALIMLFGMIPFSVFAETADNNVTVTLTLDTRTVNRNQAQLIDNDFELFDSNCEVFSVTVPAGSSVYDVLMEAASEHNFEVEGDASFVTAIGYLGEQYFTQEQQDKYLLRVNYFGYEFLASGWVYSVNGIYPSIPIGSTIVANGDKIRLAYTITGSWDIEAGGFVAPNYPNLDLNFLDALEELKASNPTGTAAAFVATIENDMAQVESYYDGFTSRWYATQQFTGPTGLQAQVDAFLP